MTNLRPFRLTNPYLGTEIVGTIAKAFPIQLSMNSEYPQLSHWNLRMYLVKTGASPFGTFRSFNCDINESARGVMSSLA